MYFFNHYTFVTHGNVNLKQILQLIGHIDLFTVYELGDFRYLIFFDKLKLQKSNIYITRVLDVFKVGLE